MDIYGAGYQKIVLDSNIIIRFSHKDCPDACTSSKVKNLLGMPNQAEVQTFNDKVVSMVPWLDMYGSIILKRLLTCGVSISYSIR
jgi:hypothetical protein